MKIPRVHKENEHLEEDVESKKKEKKKMAKRIVKCPSCGEVVKVSGKANFNHCNMLHSIEENLYSAPAKIAEKPKEPEVPIEEKPPEVSAETKPLEAPNIEMPIVKPKPKLGTHGKRQRAKKNLKPRKGGDTGSLKGLLESQWWF